MPKWVLSGQKWRADGGTEDRWVVETAQAVGTGIDGVVGGAGVCGVAVERVFGGDAEGGGVEEAWVAD